MKTIITVQHTQSIHHTNGMVGSWTDWALSDLGAEQAKRIGQRLKAELGDQRFILYSSDLMRAKQTAEYIGYEMNLKPILRQELRERNLGKCCGKSVKWLQEHMECQERTIDDRMFSDAESRRDEWDRLKPFFDEVLSIRDENILIVSHGDLLGVFNAMFLGLPPEALNNCELSGMASSVSWMFVHDNGKRHIRRMGDLSYKD